MSEMNAIRPFSGLREFEAEAYDRDLSLLLPLAEQGCAEAQCSFGIIYRLGLGGVSLDS